MLLIVAVVLMAASLAGCGREAVEVVAGPPDMVLEAHLRAVVAGDCEAARRLTTANVTVGNGELCGDVEVTSFRIDRNVASPSGRELVFHAWITTPNGSRDGSIGPGEFGWFYDLRLQDDGSWRIDGGGTGP